MSQKVPSVSTTFIWGFVLDTKQGEAVKILPDESRLKELLEINPPTSKAELHSFFGLLNTMKIWTPSLMRSLAWKDGVFRWGEDLKNEFNRVKHDLSSVLEIKLLPCKTSCNLLRCKFCGWF